MRHAGTEYAPPYAGATAEAEALIAEARARARRRRRRIAVAVVCAAALAAGTMATADGFAGTQTAARARGGAAGAAVGVPGAPRYFLDATSPAPDAYDWVEIRESATGKLVTQPQPQPPGLPPYGLAATGPRSFVLGMMTVPSDCATRFFRFQLDNQGRPGVMTAFGPTLPGDLTAMAVSAGSGLLGYAIDDTGCRTNASVPRRYLGVLDVRTGRTRQWPVASPDVNQLSMSADGRLLAFTRATSRPLPGGGVALTGMQVRVLPTDAPPGTVAQRSRVVARTAPDHLSAGQDTVLLSPSGASFYLCSRPTQTARITAYQTATGRPARVIATFPAASGSGGYYPLDCSSMALDPSGRFLLVPYVESGSLLRAAIINVSTGTRSDRPLGFAKNGAPNSIAIAW